MAEETFAVHTLVWRGDRTQHLTTLARNRADAVRQAERIGRLEDPSRVAGFLEGSSKSPPGMGSWFFKSGQPGVTQDWGYVEIYPVTQ